MLIDIYCGVQKDKLTYPFILVNFSIACSTFSTGYKDTENIRIIHFIELTNYIEILATLKFGLDLST